MKLSLLLLSLSLTSSYGDYAVAKITEIGSNNSMGEVAVFFSDVGTILAYTGRLIMVEANLDATNCVATNGCGVHIHSGYSCDTTADQGGHFYDSNLSSDPWADKKMSSSAEGIASFSDTIDIGTQDIANRVFVVHNEAGDRIGCGILEKSNWAQIFTSYISNINGSGVDGYANIVSIGLNYVHIFGTATGLEADLSAKDGDCTAANGCGAHIHTGISCFNAATQGGHYYDTATDPWSEVGYTSTTSDGTASFMSSLSIGTSDIMHRTFILHDNNGARVSCGTIYVEVDYSTYYVDYSTFYHTDASVPPHATSTEISTATPTETSTSTSAETSTSIETSTATTTGTSTATATTVRLLQLLLHLQIAFHLYLQW